MPQSPGRTAKGQTGGGEKKLEQWGRWLSGVGRRACPECRRAYRVTARDTPDERARKAKGPPCATCTPETILPGNAEAMAVYGRSAGQVIVGSMGDRIDINVLAVRCVMDVMKVRDEDECLEKVQFLAGVVFNLQAKEAQSKREREKRGG